MMEKQHFKIKFGFKLTGSQKYCNFNLQWSQEKLETVLVQNFGGTNKEYYGIFDTG